MVFKKLFGKKEENPLLGYGISKPRSQVVDEFIKGAQGVLDNIDEARRIQDEYIRNTTYSPDDTPPRSSEGYNPPPRTPPAETQDIDPLPELDIDEYIEPQSPNEEEAEEVSSKSILDKKIEDLL